MIEKHPPRLFYMTKNRYDYRIVPGEKNDKPSITVQDDSYTIRQIMERYDNGIMPVVRDMAYLDVPIEEVTSLNRPDIDLVDVEKLAKHQNNLIEKIQNLDNDLEKAKENKA